MAKVKGLFTVNGNIGDVNMYEREGRKFIRQATSLDKETMMSRPSFKRVRENMQEFGGAGTVAKAVRRALSAVAKNYGDSNLQARLLQRFRRMLKLAPGIRGERPVKPTVHPALLVGFPLNKGLSLDAVLQEDSTVTANSTRNGATLVLPALNPDVDLAVPEGASHFMVLLQVIGLSDHAFDPDIEAYTPMNPSLVSAKFLAESAKFSVDAPMSAPLTLVADLPGLPTLTTDDSLIVLVGVEFYQQVDSNYYILASGNAMDIVAIF